MAEEGAAAAAAAAGGVATETPEDGRLREEIEKAFDLFDTKKRGSVQDLEIPYIIRYLGYFPPQEVVANQIIQDIQEDEPSNFIYKNKFVKKMMEIVQEGEYLPSSEDMLLQAFRVFDKQGKGYISCAELSRLLESSGERPFDSSESEKMIATFKDPDTDNFYYEDYVAKVCAENDKFSKLAHMKGFRK